MMVDETVPLTLNGDDHAVLAKAIVFRMEHLAKQPQSSARDEEMRALASIARQANERIKQHRRAGLN